MFEKGGYIVYGTTGVCEIEDITSPNIEGVSGNRLYYVLNPCFKKGNRIFTPVDNEKVVIRAVMTQDSAYATLLYDTRREDWSGELCRMFGVEPDHLAPIIQSTDRVGGLTDRAAAELGLAPGTPVFGGGGDASLIGIGAGAAAVGSTHIYCGTSGWAPTMAAIMAFTSTSCRSVTVDTQPEVPQ